MKRKLLLIPCLVLFSLVVNAQSVVINKLFNNTNTGSQYGGGNNGQGDAVELLVLEDHTDLREVYIKETYNISSAPVGLKEGAIWQFTDNILWSNLRAGTTIQLVRPPILTGTSTAVDPVLDVDLTGDNHLLIPLSSASSDYIVSVPTPPSTWFFNLQLRDAVTLKRGTSPYGYNDLIHMLMIGYATADPIIKDEYDGITGANKAYTDHTFSGTSTNNGLLFFRNPTAETAPHNTLVDYLGADDDDNRNIIGWATTNDAPAWGIGETISGSSNAKFVSYLKDSPKIEKIEYVSAPSDSEEVTFKVTFNKKITSIAKEDFDFETTGATGAIFGDVIDVSDASLTGEGLVWNVKIGNLSGQGNIRLVKKATTNISDGTNQLFNGFVYGGSEWHTVDKDIVLSKPNVPVIVGAVNGVSNSLTPQITGVSDANLNINLYIDGARVTNTHITSNDNGEWSYNLTTPLQPGNHSFYITTNVGSIVSDQSDVLTVNFVFQKPSIPSIFGERNGISNFLLPQITGTAYPGANINLYVDGVRLTNAVITSNNNGNWSYTMTMPVQPGDHSFYVTSNLGNIVSDPSDVLTVNFVEYVTGIPAFAKSVVVNKVFNSSVTADDAVELLILDDHVDLTNLFIKDQSGNTASSTTYNDNGGKYQFRNIPLWRDLRSGTTILLRKSPTATSGYVLDTDPSDYTLDISLDDTNYFTNLGGTFNIQNYDMVVIKAGTSDVGYDNIIHSLISGVNSNTRNVFNNFPEPKMGINALIPSTRGFLYSNNPTAATTPHLGIADYSGFVNTDAPTAVTPGTTVIYNPEPPILKTSFNEVIPAYHIGEEGTNRTFISYLRSAPKIENIYPQNSGGTATSTTFTVIFNKKVTGVDINDFRVLGTGSASGKVTLVTEISDREYTVTVSELSGNGEISLVKKASGTGITDGQNFFLEGFEYLKSNRYRVDNLPVVIPIAEAPIVEGAVNSISYDFTPIIKGKANVGSQISLFIDDVPVNATITAGVTGDWFYQIPQSLSAGVHTFYITATGIYGTTQNSSVTSVNFIIEVPQAPQVRGAERGFTNMLKPAIYGNSDESTAINLYMDNVLIAENLRADVNGVWTYQILDDLPEGYHDFHVTATADVGTSEKSVTTRVLFRLFSGEITVNNILTPNGDGKNDVWLIDNLIMYPGNEVMVYDKVGNVVYRQQNYQQDWDGTSEGRLLKSGTYYYYISFGPDVPPLKGYITLLRNN